MKKWCVIGMTEQPTHAKAGRVRAFMLAIGAIIVLLAAAFLVLVGATYRGYDAELAIANELDRRYGSYDGYHVPADGRLPADRMQRFLAVRRAVSIHCAEVTDIAGRFASVGAWAKGPDPAKGQLFLRIGRALRRAPSVGLVFGRYVRSRSQGLLEQEMGLGEYSWIYVASYLGLGLAERPVPVLQRSTTYNPFEDRVYPAIRRAIARHVEASRATSGPWVEELARLKESPSRVPFHGNLPSELAASIEPFRAALAATACPAAAELDLTTTVKRGVIYEHR